MASDGGEGILRLLDLLDSEKCSVTAFFINHLYDLLAVSKTREVSIPTLTKPIWGGSMPTLQVSTSEAYFEHFTVYDNSSRFKRSRNINLKFWFLSLFIAILRLSPD